MKLRHLKITAYKDENSRQWYKATKGNKTYHKRTKKALKQVIKNHKPENEKLTGAIANLFKK